MSQADARSKIWEFVTRQRRKHYGSDAGEVLGIAQDMMNWAEQPYHARFVNWLKKERDKPVDMTDQFKMIAGTARANAIKEILAHIEHETQRARLALEDVNVGDDG